MKNFKKIAFSTLIGATLLAATAEAASSSTPAVIQSIKVQKLSLNIEVAGWLSDNKIIYSKQNPGLSLTDPATKKKINPNNIYVADIGTGKETLLVPSNTTVGGVVVSPDQKHIFFFDADSYKIINVNTLKTVNVAKVKYYKDADYASWLDNNHFIYNTNDGNIVSLDVNGKSETLLKTGKKNPSVIKLTSSTIDYSYLNPDKSTGYMSYNMQTKTSTSLKDYYPEVLSPNGSQSAMFKNGSLVLTDLKGNVLSTIVKKNVFLMSWSPDSSKLAYSIRDLSTNTTTHYVYDVKTGKQTQVNIDKKYLTTKIEWSPSGQKILFYSSNIGGFTTNIASLF